MRRLDHHKVKSSGLLVACPTQHLTSNFAASANALDQPSGVASTSAYRNSAADTRNLAAGRPNGTNLSVYAPWRGNSNSFPSAFPNQSALASARPRRVKS
jgi:hypothetical protein